MPSQKSIKDDMVVRKRIKIEKDITGTTETIKSIKDIYSFVLKVESEDFQTEASPFDNGIDINSHVLIRYKLDKLAKQIQTIVTEETARLGMTAKNFETGRFKVS